jgi:Family of unknown function (DUF6788)
VGSAVEPSLADLEQRRAQLYAELAGTDDFRRGSITENFRRCGKPNCVCAEVEHPGHGPRYLLTRSVAGKTKGRQLSPGSDLEKVRREIATYHRFVLLGQQIVEVNEAICDARHSSTLADTERTAPMRAEKGGSSSPSRRTSSQA